MAEKKYKEGRKREEKKDSPAERMREARKEKARRKK